MCRTCVFCFLFILFVIVSRDGNTSPRNLFRIYTWSADLFFLGSGGRAGGRRQVNVLAYEYSGYGKSEGTVSEDNCYADIRAAYDYLTTQKKTPPKQIVL